MGVQEAGSRGGCSIDISVVSGAWHKTIDISCLGRQFWLLIHGC